MKTLVGIIIIGLTFVTGCGGKGEHGPVEGQNWISPATGMEFVWIEPMKIWVGKYEVTNGEYRMKVPGHDSTSSYKYSLNGDRQPVVYVNFDDAKAYAEWMRSRTRRCWAGLTIGCRAKMSG